MTDPDKEALEGERVAAVAQAAREALGCEAVVIVAIGTKNSRTAVARALDAPDAETCLTVASGALFVAQQMQRPTGRGH